jgi:hypothetical protein
MTLEEKAEGVGAEMAFGVGGGRLGGFCHLPPNTRDSPVKDTVASQPIPEQGV